MLGRDTSARRGHQVHREEPRLQRRGALLEDGSGQRVDVRPADRAGVAPAPIDAGVPRHRLALTAADGLTIAVLGVHQPGDVL